MDKTALLKHPPVCSPACPVHLACSLPHSARRDSPPSPLLSAVGAEPHLRLGGTLETTFYFVVKELRLESFSNSSTRSPGFSTTGAKTLKETQQRRRHHSLLILNLAKVKPSSLLLSMVSLECKWPRCILVNWTLQGPSLTLN